MFAPTNAISLSGMRLLLLGRTTEDSDGCTSSFEELNSFGSPRSNVGEGSGREGASTRSDALAKVPRPSSRGGFSESIQPRIAVTSQKNSVLVGNGRCPVPCWMPNALDISARSPRGTPQRAFPTVLRQFFHGALSRVGVRGADSRDCRRIRQHTQSITMICNAR